MNLVAIVRAPSLPEEAARGLADATGLTLAEARMRLAPEPPALVARLEPDEASALVAELRRAGLAALAVEARCPTDRDRTVAHSFGLGSSAATFTSRTGKSMEADWPDVLAIFRGVRATLTSVEREEKTKRFAAGAALITGGVILTRTSKQTVRSSEETHENVILVYARDGRAATLAENQLDFSCLGRHMRPSSTENMVELARLLRERAKGAFYDERLLRLGRRRLPFLASRESRSQAHNVTATWADTSSSLDTLAEVMRQAAMAGLLP